MYAFIMNGEFSTFTGGVLPFTTIDTLEGFIINLSFQSTFGFVGCIGTIAIEIISCIVNNTYSVMVDLTCHSMREFSKNFNNVGTEQNKAGFRNICLRLQDIEKYIATLKEIYYLKFLLQPILVTCCVSLAIYAQLEVCFSVQKSLESIWVQEEKSAYEKIDFSHNI